MLTRHAGSAAAVAHGATGWRSSPSAEIGVGLDHRLEIGLGQRWTTGGELGHYRLLGLGSG